MKSSLVLTALLFSVSAFAGEFKSQEEILKKLTTYSFADIEGDEARLKNREPLKIDEMFNDLEAASKFIKSAAVSEDLAFELERVCLLTMVRNPAGGGLDRILNVYANNRSTFIRAFRGFHPEDQSVLKESFKGKSDAEKYGQ
jgi:hypothetical protein